MLNYILIITGLDAVIARRDEEGASAVEYGLWLPASPPWSWASSSCSAA